MWVSQPGSSTEQPNPQIPDITSSSRPGPSASPSPSFLPPLWGQGRDSGLAQFRKDHPHQGLTHSRAGLSGRPHPRAKNADKGARGGGQRDPNRHHLQGLHYQRRKPRPTAHWPALSQRGGRNCRMCVGEGSTALSHPAGWSRFQGNSREASWEEHSLHVGLP